MMLADAVEASTRSLQNITPGAVRAQVAKIVNLRIADGQLDECPLTLKDLHVVSETFVQTVLSYHHHRVEYPDPIPTQDGRGRSSPGSITLEIPPHTPPPDAVDNTLDLEANKEAEGREKDDDAEVSSTAEGKEA